MRRAPVLQEANAIGTTCLCVAPLPERIRKLQESAATIREARLDFYGASVQ
jgi:hypothetical protein